MKERIKKIVFICGSIEQGKDGIGDYTRRLAEACICKGVKAGIISLYDTYVDTIEISTASLSVLRIPKEFTVKQKIEAAKAFLAQNQPDWISIQFMPYTLNNRGIIYSQTELFRALTFGIPVQLMFHELWIGEEKGASLKNKVLGKLQQYFIKKFLKQIEPRVIHVSININQKILDNYNISSLVLPLFGNIPITISKDPAWIFEEIQKVEQRFTLSSRHEYLIFTIFGSLYPDWNLESLFYRIRQDIDHKKKIIFISIGNLGSGESYWNSLSQKHPDFSFYRLGRRSEQEISEFLQFADIGVITTPLILQGKSGSFWALKEHGLPIVSDTNKIQFNFRVNSEEIESNQVILIDKDPINFQKLRKNLPFSNLNNVAEQFLKDLSINYIS